MTHEEFGKYLGLTMVIKRLVSLLPPEDREKMEKACRDTIANGFSGAPEEEIKDFLQIKPHVTATFDDIFSSLKNDA